MKPSRLGISTRESVRASSTVDLSMMLASERMYAETAYISSAVSEPGACGSSVLDNPIGTQTVNATRAFNVPFAYGVKFVGVLPLIASTNGLSTRSIYSTRE